MKIAFELDMSGRIGVKQSRSVMWKFACLDEECRTALDRTAEGGGCPQTSFSANAKERGAYAVQESSHRHVANYRDIVPVTTLWLTIVPVCSPLRVFESCVQKIEGKL
jgi:hypothetical protein